MHAEKHHLSRWGTKNLLHFLHLFSLSGWSRVSTVSSWITCSLTTGVFLYIFIEHQHLDLGLTQLLQYTAKHSSYVSCFIKFKKDQYECTNNLWIVYSSKYNISSVALLYVIILIYKHFKLIYRYWNSSLLSQNLFLWPHGQGTSRL